MKEQGGGARLPTPDTQCLNWSAGCFFQILMKEGKELAVFLEILMKEHRGKRLLYLATAPAVNVR